MGGNCLKKYNIETVRLNRVDYLDLETEVFEKISSAGINILKIPYYRDKKNFGDMDAVIEFEENRDYKYEIYQLFHPRVIAVNDGVYSFDYRNFQVDLLCRKTEDLECVVNYMSWNDLGNLQGRFYHAIGTNYGWQGLRFPIRQKLFDENIDDNSDHVIKTLTLSKNPREIMEFGGYDYDRFLAGFDTLEEIFIFATSTPYFNGYNFQLENLNHTNKTRNRKRDTFMKFLEWLKKHPEYDKQFNFGDKKNWIDKIDKKWPIKEEIEKERSNFLQHKANAAKFNGNLVRYWCPGLEGKQLGKVLSEFKFYRGMFSDAQTFEGYLQMYPAEKIKSDFFAWIKKSKVYSMSEPNS